MDAVIKRTGTNWNAAATLLPTTVQYDFNHLNFNITTNLSLYQPAIMEGTSLTGYAPFFGYHFWKSVLTPGIC